MSLIAVFTAPKPFTNPHISLIQRNAIANWKALGPEVEVWLVGDEEGAAEAASELGVGFLPQVARNESGTPRIDSIFDLVRQASTAPILAYTNADILFLPDFMETIKAVQAQAQHYLLVGQRWDLDISEPLQFDPGWDKALSLRRQREGKLHTATGSDYFVFPRQDYTSVPPFAVGRAGWDNWMIYAGRVNHIPVVDASSSITAIHQNHDYSHFANGKTHRLQPETLENINLMGGRFAVYSLLDADRQVHAGKVVRAPLTRWKILREISIFPAVTLHCEFLARIFYVIFNLKRFLRDRKRDRALMMEQK